MKFGYALVGMGVILLGLAIFGFVRRSHLTAESDELQREQAGLLQEGKPEERERFLRVLEQSSQVSSQTRNAGISGIVCLVLGIGAGSLGMFRLRKLRKIAPGSLAER